MYIGEYTYIIACTQNLIQSMSILTFCLYFIYNITCIYSVLRMYIGEARDMFWGKFIGGTNFAKTQSKWDLLFLTLGAMGRDESLFEYLFRILINILFNFTIGICSAVIAFMFSLYSLISSYQPSYLECISFFMLASLAASSFALTWLIMLYTAAAGMTMLDIYILYMYYSEYLYMFTLVYVYTCICIHLYMYTLVYVYTCMCSGTCIHLYVQRYMYTLSFCMPLTMLYYTIIYICMSYRYGVCRR